ncbi:HET-domain-containing protein [Annulohypoxylon bovei var. microspora]|nr:HET-domain-containing protein [Annulohypoxylon bovei var. microspora]
MLCQVCKDGLESIGNSRRCLEKSHTINAEMYSGRGVERLQTAYQGTPIYRCWCVWEQHPFGHHRDEESFWRSARQGCVICSDFPFENHQDNQSSDVQELGFFTIFKVSRNGSNRFNMTVESDYGSKTVELIPVKDHSILNGTLNFDLHGSTDSPQTWSAISNWRETCLLNHERCKNEAQGVHYKPTRLLQINSQSSTSRDAHTFRLVNGNQCPMSLPYVTLSYRWGNKSLDDTIRLLEETSNWLQMSNPITHLPKTFRDAMYIAYLLGIQYIWIDRLCIYQDFPEDWSKEASTMQDVYRNASFCISALSGEDDEGGCFFHRNPALVAPTPINLNGEKDAFMAELEDTSWRTSFQDEPLIERGWVLQERLMSPRTIHFGKKQVFWECAELHACETHPNGFGGFPLMIDYSSSKQHGQQDGASPRLWKQLIATPTVQRTTADWRVQIFASWSATISLYSGTKLTKPSDRLIAVSGLAQDMRKELQRHDARQYRYLVGLWEDVLIETLVWYVRVGVPASRPVGFQAPSWSWVSLDGGHITMPDKFYSEVSKFSYLLSTSPKFLREDDTREVKSSGLPLCGPVCLVDTGASLGNQYEVEAFRRLDGIRPARCDEGDQDWLGKPSVIFDTIENSKDVFCIWMVAQPALRGWQASGIAMHFIEGIKYRRIGVVYCYYPDRDSLHGFVNTFIMNGVKII